jgi:hypothetical protein
MMTILHEQATRLRLARENISDDEFISILNTVNDGFARYGVVNGEMASTENLKLIRSLCKHMVDSHTYKQIVRPRIISHKIFSLMSFTLLHILQKSSNTSTIDNDELNFRWSIFHAISTLLTSSLHSDNVEQKKINQIIQETYYNDQFLLTIKATIEIISSGDHPDDHIMCKIVHYLIANVYTECETCDQRLQLYLLNPLNKCITSQLYADLFVGKSNRPIQFFLSDCPRVILHMFNVYPRETSGSICEALLKNAQTILSSHRNRKHKNCENNEWNKYLSHFLHLLNRCLMTESIRGVFTAYGSCIVVNLFAIIKLHVNIDAKKNSFIIKDADLVAIALTILYNLMFNSTIRTIITEHIKDSPMSQLANIDEDNTVKGDKARNDDAHKTIYFAAQSLVALTMEDIDKLDKVEEITSSYVSYLAKAVRDESQAHEGIHASTILADVKSE